ncbi:helix-turn-helix domain-containing protein [Dysgonomonas sp. 520]|uniref:helix-turn-helix domain-containing protein n=1 Tax=Dysgonomonas sp. 520 TaxID=2302931 RepID=UPI0013D6BE6B|nr:helix-turn-helix domain-containing protein [Dysgonomonas sp. 520]
MRHYDEKESSLIQFLTFEQDFQWQTREDESRIVMLTQGKLNITFCSMQNPLIISESKMFFLPAGDSLSAKALEKSSVIVIKTGKDYCLDELNISSIHGAKPNTHYLQMNSTLHTYVQSLRIYKESRINDDDLHILKIRELVCIMKMSYSDIELSGFFRLHQTNDFYFSEQVRKLSHNNLNVRLLAEQMNFSYSGFNKRFRKAFGMSAYNWLRKRRADMVYYELFYTDKSLKQISTDNKFATLSHFNEFCHKILGDSPRQLRKNKPLSLTE